MIQTFTLETFSIGDRFKIYYEEEKFIELTLAKVEKGKYKLPDEFRQPFSMLFRSSKEVELLQGMYNMVHDKVGNFELFIVPVLPNSRGVEGNYYEAVFS